MSDVVHRGAAVLMRWRFVGEDDFDDAFEQQKTTLLHLDQAIFFHVVLRLDLLVSPILCALMLFLLLICEAEIPMLI
jgi:hypothetical protein